MTQEKDDPWRIKNQVRALLMAGYSVDQIAEALGFSSVDDVRAISDELFADEGLESIEDKRSLDNQRLEELMAQFWYKATGKVEVPFDEQLRAAKIFLRLMAQRARLMGLNKDPRVEALKEKNEKYTVIWDVFEPLKKDMKKKNRTD